MRLIAFYFAENRGCAAQIRLCVVLAELCVVRGDVNKTKFI
jgi:hypothetical protein